MVRTAVKTKRKTKRYEMRASPEFLRLLDGWRRKQPGDIPSRAEAIVTLCESALMQEKPAPRQKYQPSADISS